ncbi:peptidylprolyl isomerase [Paenibacillus cremeus]|uniref:Peptidylprolyl isomerase n=2 Tax=Paenibacillus cremeus TaxID=2163881 RepID=A0A559KHW9_9BACL|nr:peptidylprolyl isomerase [Paenibacillus cremeus]
MNDKVKGLVLGLSLGVMLTGSIAYASGTQIEVYFKNLKYMFDGIEKKPTEDQGSGFIYNGTTYVPLRFVSEALGKEVGFDADTDTIWVGKNPTTIVSTYKGGQVTQADLDKYMAVTRVLNPQNAQYETQKAYKEYLVKQLIGYRVLSGRMTDEMKAALPDAVNAQFEELKQMLLNSQQGTDFATILSKNGITEQDLRAFIEQHIATGKVLNALTSDAALQAAYDEKAKTGQFITASVRHILIGFTDASGKARSKEDALKLANEVKAKLDNGGNFADLAKQYSDDPGSKDNGGLYADAAVSDWVEPFKKAAIELELNKISDPVETTYGYHVMRVEARSTRTLNEVKDQLLQDFTNQDYNKFMTQELPTLIEKLEVPGK